MLKKSEHAVKVDQIRDALRGIAVIPKNRYIRRYTHGWSNRERAEYFIGYTWSRPHSNHMTGMVYDTTIAKGRDFDDALAKARAIMLKKRAAQVATSDAD